MTHRADAVALLRFRGTADGRPVIVKTVGVEMRSGGDYDPEVVSHCLRLLAREEALKDLLSVDKWSLTFLSFVCTHGESE